MIKQSPNDLRNSKTFIHNEGSDATSSICDRGLISKETVKPKSSTELTDRELEVLRNVAMGATNKKISERLSISPHTVKSHVVHIFNKLGVNDRVQAAVWAVKQNIL